VTAWIIVKLEHRTSLYWASKCISWIWNVFSPTFLSLIWPSFVETGFLLDTRIWRHAYCGSVDFLAFINLFGLVAYWWISLQVILSSKLLVYYESIDKNCIINASIHLLYKCIYSFIIITIGRWRIQRESCLQRTQSVRKCPITDKRSLFLQKDFSKPLTFRILRTWHYLTYIQHIDTDWSEFILL